VPVLRPQEDVPTAENFDRFVSGLIPVVRGDSPLVSCEIEAGLPDGGGLWHVQALRACTARYFPTGLTSLDLATGLSRTRSPAASATPWRWLYHTTPALHPPPPCRQIRATPPVLRPFHAKSIALVPLLPQRGAVPSVATRLPIYTLFSSALVWRDVHFRRRAEEEWEYVTSFGCGGGDSKPNPRSRAVVGRRQRVYRSVLVAPQHRRLVLSVLVLEASGYHPHPPRGGGGGSAAPTTLLAMVAFSMKGGGFPISSSASTRFPFSPPYFDAVGVDSTSHGSW
jgi:hypothetical protein